MKIESLHIDGFGHFHNNELAHLSPKLTVFLGNNEVGKSTLLAFIRNILFGFPDGRSKENPFPPLVGGRHGGRLKLIDSHGMRYTVERHAGKGSGPVTVVPEGQAQVAGETALQGLLGQAGRGLFQNVFAFSLNELQQFDTLEDDEVKSALYSAGLGAAVANLPKVEKALEYDAGIIFRPGGSKPRLNTHIRELEDLRKKLLTLPNEPEEYLRLCEELNDLAHRSEELKRKRRDLELTLRLTERLTEAWPTWIKLREIRKSLTALPEARRFPADGLDRLDKLAKERRDREAQLVVAKERQDKLQQQLQALAVDHHLIKQGEKIERLSGRRSEWEQLCQELPALQRLENAVQTQLERELRSLGPKWDLERLREVDASLPTLSRIQSHARALNGITHKVARAQERVDEAQERVETTLKSREACAQEIEKAPRPNPALDVVNSTTLRETLYRWRTALENERQAEQEVNQARNIAEDALQQLGPGWDEARIQETKPDRDAIDRVRRFQGRLDQTEARVREQKAELKASEQNQQEKSDHREELRQQLDGLSLEPSAPEKTRILRDDLRRARRELRKELELLARRERARDRLEAESGLAGMPAWMVCLPLVSGLLLGGILVQQKMTEMGIAVVVVMAVISLALWGWNWTRGNQNERSAHRKEEAEKELETVAKELEVCSSLLKELGSALGLSGTPKGDELDRLEDSLDRDAKDLHRRQILMAELKRTDSSMEKLQRGLETERSELDRREKELEALCREWREWLVARSLPDSLFPEDARDRLEEIRRTLDLLSRSDACEKRLREIRSSVKDLAGRLCEELGKTGREVREVSEVGIIDEAVVRLITDRDQQKKDSDRYESRHENLKVLEKANIEAVRTLNQRREEFEQAQASYETAEQRWRLDEAYQTLEADSPQEAVSLLERANLARGYLDDFNQKQTARENAQERRDALFADAQKLFRVVGRELSGPEELTTALDRILVNYKQTVENAQNRRTLRIRLEEMGEDENGPQVLSRKLLAIKGEIETLYATAGVDNEETFREVGQVEARRTKLQSEEKGYEQSLAASAGSHPYNEFLQRLSDVDPDQLVLDGQKLGEDLSELEQKLAEHQKQSGSITEQMKQVESSNERARLRQEEETLLETIKVEANQWAVLQIGVRLLKEARAQYERQRQPAVIQRASEHFSNMTRGRYPRLVTPPGDESILVERPDGKRLGTRELSRGTAEQQYLALRLGFIREFSRRSEPLPLVMDDIFVNFDPGRARAAMEEVLTLTDQHQILFFTCHPETVGRIKEIVPDVDVRNLQRKVVSSV